MTGNHWKNEELLKDVKMKEYELKGWIEHKGNGWNEGHYISNCWSSKYGKWYKLNDHNVSVLPEFDKVKSKDAYLIFYELKNI